jgi:lipoyl(octanoyl) transferase
MRTDSASSNSLLHTKFLGLLEYATVFQAMRSFSETRGTQTPDELWICQHPAVFTQGVAGKSEHILNARGVPVVITNRGGQVTYHGPGQILVYPLLNLRRLGIYVKEYVYRLEHAIIKTLEYFNVTGYRVPGAPGVYVDADNPGGHRMLQSSAEGDFGGLSKIAAIGVKVTQHCTYHGLALNVKMDLSPFGDINPCGYANLPVIDLFRLGVRADLDDVENCLRDKLVLHFS